MKHRGLRRFLVFMGLLDFSAVAIALGPLDWIATPNRWLGLGEFPAAPIAEYLARSASLMYALHGATILFVARDIERYLPLVRFLAVGALVHGGLLCWVDYRIGMPWQWNVLEGPTFAATGIAALLLTRN